MSKSEKTYELEEIITIATARLDRVGCPEVTLGDYGIVDFISMDIGGARTVRCYELKISKSDFLSDAKKTFIGDFNYYVIPTELWGHVRNYIEKGIGVWTVDSHGKVEVKKKASRMQCKMNRSEILSRILRALNRENLKHCENKWRERQIHKKVADIRGGDIEIGDIVEYRQEHYEVIEISYIRDDTSTTPTLTLALVNDKRRQIDNVTPAIVRKVSLSAIITETE